MFLYQKHNCEMGLMKRAFSIEIYIFIHELLVVPLTVFPFLFLLCRIFHSQNK